MSDYDLVMAALRYGRIEWAVVKRIGLHAAAEMLRRRLARR